MESEKIETRITILAYLPTDISDSIHNAKELTGVSYPNHETSVPHITLYSCKFDEHKFEDLIHELKELKLAAFSIKLSHLSLVANSKGKNLFASIGFQNSAPLQKIHEEVLRVANGLRGTLIREKDVDRFNKAIYSPEKFEHIKKYGYEYSKEYFDPHITLGEVNKDDTKKATELKKLLQVVEGAEIPVDRISVLLSQRYIPSEKKVKESQQIEIKLTT